MGPTEATSVAASPLELDDFARLTARMEIGEPRADILADAGMTLDRWLEAQQMWLERMGTRAAKGQPTLHRRFVALVEKYRLAEAERRESTKRSGDLPLPPEPRGAALLAPVPRKPRTARKAAAELPTTSPMRGQVKAAANFKTSAMPAIASHPALPFAGEERAVKRGQRKRALAPGQDTALPFKPGSSRPPPPAGPPPSGKDLKGETFDESARAPSSPLPFRKGAAMAPLPAIRIETKAHRDPLGATLELPPDQAAAARAALPFDKGASGKQGARASKTSTRDALASTADVSPEEAAKLRAALPFGGARGGAAKRAAAPADGALPFKANRPAPAPQGGFANLPNLTLEQYAWLCAALEVAPDREAQTLAWMRISVDGKRQLDIHWRHELKRDPRIKAEFDRARDKYLREATKR